MLGFMSICLPLVWFCIYRNWMINPGNILKKTKWEVTHKNALTKWVYQHKMQNVVTSDDERKIDQEYQKLKRNKVKFLLFVKRKYEKLENKITYP